MRAHEILTRASAAHRGHDTIRPFAFTLYASGSLDKSAEGQGHTPGVPSPGRFVESLAIEDAGNRVAWEYREDRFDGTHEWFREAYPTRTERLYVVHDLGLAITAQGDELDGARWRLLRRLPGLLIEELLQHPRELRYAGRRGEWDIVMGRLPSDVPIGLYVARRDRRLGHVEIHVDLPARGNTVIEWWWSDYRGVPDVGLMPHRYGISVGGVSYTELTVDSIVSGPSPLFVAPHGYRQLPGRPVPAPATQPSVSTVDTVAPGIYRALGVRGGFDPMFIEQDDHVIAIDAPASYPLLGQLPPGETDPGPTMSWVSERFIETIHSTVPGKPIRYVILTHGHEDHIGGVRAFVAEGAIVLASSALRDDVERIVGLEPSVGDRLARDGGRLQFSPVDSTTVLGRGDRRVEVMAIGTNPHAVGMLIVYVPSDRFLFVSDLVTPDSSANYPRASHAVLDRYFGGWLRARQLDVATIYAMHGGGPIAAGRVRDLAP